MYLIKRNILRSIAPHKKVESEPLHTIISSLQTIWYIAWGVCNEMNYSIEALKWSACDNNIHYPIKQSENATCLYYINTYRITQSTPQKVELIINEIPPPKFKIHSGFHMCII